MGILQTSPKDMDVCIDLCQRCARACEECFAACLKEADVQARTMCIHHLEECADMCFLAVKLMSANSPMAKSFCAMCAQMCGSCAQECSKFKDQHCQDCAKICQECAEECRQMAG
ncbi:MAG: four-helix bundle copper-binding protein [Methylocystaceae bacterium]